MLSGLSCLKTSDVHPLFPFVLCLGPRGTVEEVPWPPRPTRGTTRKASRLLSATRELIHVQYFTITATSPESHKNDGPNSEGAEEEEDDDERGGGFQRRHGFAISSANDVFVFDIKGMEIRLLRCMNHRPSVLPFACNSSGSAAGKEIPTQRGLDLQEATMIWGHTIPSIGGGGGGWRGDSSVKAFLSQIDNGVPSSAHAGLLQKDPSSASFSSSAGLQQLPTMELPTSSSISTDLAPFSDPPAHPIIGAAVCGSLAFIAYGARQQVAGSSSSLSSAVVPSHKVIAMDLLRCSLFLAPSKTSSLVRVTSSDAKQKDNPNATSVLCRAMIITPLTKAAKQPVHFLVAHPRAPMICVVHRRGSIGADAQIANYATSDLSMGTVRIYLVTPNKRFLPYSVFTLATKPCAGAALQVQHNLLLDMAFLPTRTSVRELMQTSSHAVTNALIATLTCKELTVRDVSVPGAPMLLYFSTSTAAYPYTSLAMPPLWYTIGSCTDNHESVIYVQSTLSSSGSCGNLLALTFADPLSAQTKLLMPRPRRGRGISTTMIDIRSNGLMTAAGGGGGGVDSSILMLLSCRGSLFLAPDDGVGRGTIFGRVIRPLTALSSSSSVFTGPSTPSISTALMCDTLTVDTSSIRLTLLATTSQTPDGNVLPVAVQFGVILRDAPLRLGTIQQLPLSYSSAGGAPFGSSSGLRTMLPQNQTVESVALLMFAERVSSTRLRNSNGSSNSKSTAIAKLSGEPKWRSEALLIPIPTLSTLSRPSAHHGEVGGGGNSALALIDSLGGLDDGGQATILSAGHVVQAHFDARVAVGGSFIDLAMDPHNNVLWSLRETLPEDVATSPSSAVGGGSVTLYHLPFSSIDMFTSRSVGNSASRRERLTTVPAGSPVHLRQPSFSNPSRIFACPRRDQNEASGAIGVILYYFTVVAATNQHQHVFAHGEVLGESVMIENRLVQQHYLRIRSAATINISAEESSRRRRRRTGATLSKEEEEGEEEDIFSHCSIPEGDRFFYHLPVSCDTQYLSDHDLLRSSVVIDGRQFVVDFFPSGAAGIGSSEGVGGGGGVLEAVCVEVEGSDEGGEVLSSKWLTSDTVVSEEAGSRCYSCEASPTCTKICTAVVPPVLSAARCQARWVSTAVASFPPGTSLVTFSASCATVACASGQIIPAWEEEQAERQRVSEVTVAADLAITGEMMNTTNNDEAIIAKLRAKFHRAQERQAKTALERGIHPPLGGASAVTVSWQHDLLSAGIESAFRTLLEVMCRKKRQGAEEIVAVAAAQQVTRLFERLAKAAMSKCLGTLCLAQLLSQRHMELLTQLVGNSTGSSAAELLTEADFFNWLNFVSCWILAKNDLLVLPLNQSESPAMPKRRVDCLNLLRYAAGSSARLEAGAAERMGLSWLARLLSIAGNDVQSSSSSLVYLPGGGGLTMQVLNWSRKAFISHCTALTSCLAERPQAEEARNNFQTSFLSSSDGGGGIAKAGQELLWQSVSNAACLCRVPGPYDLVPRQLRRHFELMTSRRKRGVGGGRKKGAVDRSVSGSPASSLSPSRGVKSASPGLADPAVASGRAATDTPLSKHGDGGGDDDDDQQTAHPHESVAKEQEALRNKFLQSFRNEAQGGETSSDDGGEEGEGGTRRNKASRRLRLAGIVFRPVPAVPAPASDSATTEQSKLTGASTVVAAAAAAAGDVVQAARPAPPSLTLKPPTSRMPPPPLHPPSIPHQSAEFATLFHSLDHLSGTTAPTAAVPTDMISTIPARSLLTQNNAQQNADAVCMDSDDSDGDGAEKKAIQQQQQQQRTNLFEAAPSGLLGSVVLGGGGPSLGTRRRVGAMEGPIRTEQQQQNGREAGTSSPPSSAVDTATTPQQAGSLSKQSIADLAAQAVSALDNNKFASAAKLFLVVLRGTAAAATRSKGGGEDDGGGGGDEDEGTPSQLESYCHNHVAARLLAACILSSEGDAPSSASSVASHTHAVLLSQLFHLRVELATIAVAAEALVGYCTVRCLPKSASIALAMLRFAAPHCSSLDRLEQQVDAAAASATRSEEEDEQLAHSMEHASLLDFYTLELCRAALSKCPHCHAQFEAKPNTAACELCGLDLA